MGLITLQEAAQRLRVSRATLYRWSREGRIMLYHVGPRSTRIREEDIGRLEAGVAPLHGPLAEQLDPWEEAGEADLGLALRVAESDLPAGSLAFYLSQTARAGTPVLWNAELEEFEELSGL